MLDPRLSNTSDSGWKIQCYTMCLR